MHPDVMRELANQRGREMRARAREAALASRLRKEMRRRTAAAADVILLRIPDYDERPGRRQAAGRRAA
jgi:hypothetical protein